MSQEVQVKKVFAEVFALLSAEENQNKKVKTILADVSVLMSKQTNSVGETSRYDEEGNLTHVYCYYHKDWEDVNEVPYGKKAKTKTGLNTMCKQGVSNWTKQQRAKKKAESELLDKLATGEVQADELEDLRAKIEADSKVIVPLALEQ